MICCKSEGENIFKFDIELPLFRPQWTLVHIFSLTS